jgi:hypothetical protein
VTEAGLEAALPSLATLAPIAVKMHDVTDRRLPAPVEAGAYVAIDEAIRDAAARHATSVSVSSRIRRLARPMKRRRASRQTDRI